MHQSEAATGRESWVGRVSTGREMGEDHCNGPEARCEAYSEIGQWA